MFLEACFEHSFLTETLDFCRQLIPNFRSPACKAPFHSTDFSLHKMYVICFVCFTSGVCCTGFTFFLEETLHQRGSISFEAIKDKVSNEVFVKILEFQDFLAFLSRFCMFPSFGFCYESHRFFCSLSLFVAWSNVPLHAAIP